MALITLTTDFGLEDEYVGVLKGVILSTYPKATVIDITHQVPPHDITHAAYLFESVYPFFKPGTVHVLVVDPGVGSFRDILAVRAAGQYVIAPDNGVLTLLVANDAVESAVKVTNSQYFLTSVSATFHGRDIFAPVAAQLAQGLDMSRLGPKVGLRNLIRLPNMFPQKEPDGSLLGKIVTMDHFGNLITNLKEKDISQLGPVTHIKKIWVHLGRRTILNVVNSYATVAKGRPLAIIGSRGYLEIAVNCGRAADYFKIGAGAQVKIMVADTPDTN
jgi:S-adenosylmethionine hydrolase